MAGTVAVALGRTLSVMRLDLVIAILIPSYNMASIMADLEGRHYFTQLCQLPWNCTGNLLGGNGTQCRVGGACVNFRPDPLSFDGNASGRYLLILTLQSFVFYALLALSESNIYDRFKQLAGFYPSSGSIEVKQGTDYVMEAEMADVPQRREEDDGVKGEREYILSTPEESLRTSNAFIVK